MVFSFRFWWLCNFKHTEGVPMAQLFATEIYTTIWTLPKAKGTQIFDEEHCGSSGIALTEYMNLPESGYKHSKMMNDFIHRKILIREIPLFRKIVIQCILQLRSATVKYRSAVKHPFLLALQFIWGKSRVDRHRLRPRSRRDPSLSERVSYPFRGRRP